MTKQEEIREGIAKQLFANFDAIYRIDRRTWEQLSKFNNIKQWWLTQADKILSYLHSKGVVIKVFCRNCQHGYVIHRTNKTRCSVCKGKGYVVAELLIEEVTYTTEEAQDLPAVKEKEGNE